VHEKLTLKIYIRESSKWRSYTSSELSCRADYDNKSRREKYRFVIIPVTHS